MKLPFSNALSPILKPHFGRLRLFCQQPAFKFSQYYTNFYSILGLLISANHLRNHLGETTASTPATTNERAYLINDTNNPMLLHDLKIISTALGILQYASLLAGCLTENPALFLPHLGGQLLTVIVMILNVLLTLAATNPKSKDRLRHKIPKIMLMTFNWCQEFCTFRKCLCICDL